ncbi:flavin reductase family protein [Curtanaerobium respiraculi]|uniref:flavin reductase family protein n=1 Tax=Curtanaerobium respiraculi TaxID=2949669 RepID=UPI0024B38ED6|nr:flavin reductase family protein [Curtanaerobium respiraculi]
MSKKNIGSKLALYPCPVAVIGTIAEGGKPTWTLVAHMGIMGHDHVMVSLAQPHYINSFIKENGALSINVVDEGWVAKADLCGMVSGNTQSKSDFFTWTAGDAGAPVVDDAKLVMECSVEDVYGTKGFDNFICAIANTYADEAILNDKGKPDYDSFEPVLFEMPNYNYEKSGGVLAPCLSFAKDGE